MKWFSKVGPIAIAMLLAIEVVFRFLPVSNGYFLADVTSEQPVARRIANLHGTVSDGWLMTNAVTRRINNDGFVNAADYFANGERPIIAFIGDSQIEAPRIQEGEALHSRVREALGGGIAVHTFAMSGAPLTQYAVWADHAVANYAPDQLVFFISPNDFDESFARFGLFPGFHYLSDSGDDAILREYRRGWGSRLVQHSALLAYIVHNVDLPALISSASGNTGTRLSDAEMNRLLDWFFDELAKSGIGPASAFFVMNPPERTYNENGCNATSARTPSFDAFQNAAAALGYRVLFAAETFCVYHRETGERLVLDDGVHWNARGHEAMARLVSAGLRGTRPE